MPNMTDAQAEHIAQSFSEMASFYATNANKVRDEYYDAWIAKGRFLSATSSNITTNLQQRDFENVNDAFQYISDLGIQATAKAKQLGTEIININKQFSIAASMINFGVAIMSGDYLAAGKILAGAIRSS